jgi:hypothetical protein
MPSVGDIQRDLPRLVMPNWKGLREFDRMMDTVRANRQFHSDGSTTQRSTWFSARRTLARRADRAKRYLNEATRLALPFRPTPL